MSLHAQFLRLVFATCNSTTKLRHRLLSRAVIEMKPYESFEEFKNIIVDVCKHPLAEYIAERVYQAKNPKIRDCVRIASMAKTEQDVLRMMRILK